LASADSAQRAQTLFDDGQRLLDQNKVDDACDKFTASVALDPALGARLNLAYCRERQNRLVEAYELFTIVAEDAQRAGKPSQLDFARKHAEALAAKVVRVSLHVADPTRAGLAIKLGGRVLPPESWTRAVVIAPGAIVVEATAPEHEPFRTSQDAAPGAQLVIDVPALEVHREAPQLRVLAAEPMPARTHSLTPWIVGGVGAASLVTAGGLLVHAKLLNNDGKAHATPQGDAELATSQREGNICTALSIAGTIAVGVGVYLYVRERRAVILPVTDGHDAGAAVVGTW
jgi:hypothetical protein